MKNSVYILSFFIISILILAGCSTISAKDGENISGAVSGNNPEVESFSPAELYMGRTSVKIKKPADYEVPAPEKIVIEDDSVTVNLFASEFAQGNAGYFEIVKKSGFSGEVKKITFSGSDIPFAKTPWGVRGFFAVHPEAKPGKSLFTVSYNRDESDKKVEGAVIVRDVAFPVSTTILDLGKYSDKAYTSKPEFRKLIEESAEARKKAFSIMSEDSITDTLSHPRDMHKVTGVYWKKRVYATYKKKGKKKVKVPGHTSYHRGVDLKGDAGAPVYAMADGRVVLVMKMFYEGNFIAVDHGNKVFTYYMHMDSITVKEGDTVKAGDVIGGVGSTGTSTGPHLHVALSIRGVHVHPLSLLSLPVSR